MLFDSNGSVPVSTSDVDSRWHAVDDSWLRKNSVKALVATEQEAIAA